MPKIKTNKAVKKRFKITKNGKVLSTKALRRHLLTDRSSKKKRNLRGWRLVSKTEDNKFKLMLPYDR